MSYKEIGLRTDNLKTALIPYSILTFIGVFSLFVLAILLHKQPLALWWKNPHEQWFFLPISIAQEFVFRSLIQTWLKKFLSPMMNILFVALLYSSVHIFWKDPVILLLTFVAGLGWGYLWYKDPNLYLISLSHAVLNFFAIYLGFFPWLLTDIPRFIKN